MRFPKLLSNALTIGERMLCSGAEVSRVEDSITRICTAYGAKNVNVLTITSSIVVTADYDGKSHTHTRRIKNYKTDLSKLDALNSLSREICNMNPDSDYIEMRLSEIENKKQYPVYLQTVGWALAAGAFTVFFGGSYTDGLISALIGTLTKLSVSLIEGREMNKVFSNIFASFIISACAYLSVLCNFGQSSDKIIIGNIMLLIPGLSLTNSIRDLIGGDMIAGTIRLFEALITALAIAGGYFVTVILFGGVI